MIEIKKAEISSTEVLSLLGRLTYNESHGHFIHDKNDLEMYLNDAFSISKTKKDIINPKNLFYIIYVNDLPVGYAKLVLNALNENVASQNVCQLERIYILNDFIPLKIGQQFLTFLEKQAKELQLDTMWLSVYMKNKRAVRFYQKNKFKNMGELNFLVNGTGYKTVVFSKSVLL